MANERSLLPVEAWPPMVERLARLPDVTRHGPGEAEALVHALSDLEDSFRVYLDKHLPRALKDGLTDEERLDALVEIGEEVRHIAYHLYVPAFFRMFAEHGQSAALESEQDSES